MHLSEPDGDYVIRLGCRWALTQRDGYDGSEIFTLGAEPADYARSSARRGIRHPVLQRSAVAASANPVGVLQGETYLGDRRGADAQGADQHCAAGRVGDARGGADAVVHERVVDWSPRRRHSPTRGCATVCRSPAPHASAYVGPGSRCGQRPDVQGDRDEQKRQRGRSSNTLIVPVAGPPLPGRSSRVGRQSLSCPRGSVRVPIVCASAACTGRSN